MDDFLSTFVVRFGGLKIVLISPSYLEIKKRFKMKVGDRYNYWEIMELLPENKALCLCLGCNQVKKAIKIARLKNQSSKSCGCKRVEFRKQTNLERYGHEFTSNVPEIQQKIKDHFIEKYGVDNPRKASQVKDKIKNIKKKKYGEHQEKVVAKFKKTLKERYGVEGVLEIPDAKEKKTNTMLDRYGTEHALQNKEILLKLQQTNLERYGTDNPLKIKEVREKRLKIKRDFVSPQLKNTMLKILKTIDKDISFWNKAPKEKVGIRCRLDFRLEVNKKIVYINVDRLCLDSEPNKPKDYYFRLRKHFEDNNLQFLQFREDEIRDKPKIVKSIILSTLNILSNKINARDCEVRPIDSITSKQFLESNHLMGNYVAAKSYGLFYQDELLQVMSIRKIGDTIEISRFCTKIDFIVRGGFSKLLKKIGKIYQPKQIVSFCDLRYANGKSYDKNGFKRVSANQGWCWTDGTKTFNRLKCRTNMDFRKLSEKDYAWELGWYKIYDAGQAKYILKI